MEQDIDTYRRRAYACKMSPAYTVHRAVSEEIANRSLRQL